MTKSLIKRIEDRIADSGRGWCFTQEHFSDLGNYDAVRQALSRLNNVGFIQRLAPGLYHFPRYHDDIGELPPKIENVIKAVKQSQKIKCQPSGAYAANLLGLSEQVPAKTVVLTDGPSRKIKIANQEIIFKKTVPRNMATAETITGLITQAFKYIGKDNINQKHIDIIKNRLDNSDLIELKRNAYLAPAWIAKIIKSKIIGE